MALIVVVMQGLTRRTRSLRSGPVQILRVGEGAGDESNEYVKNNMRKVFEAVNEVIAASSRESEVNSLTNPAFFKMRKEPIENVHAALLEHWDAIRASDKAFFIFIASLKHGVKTLKRPRDEGSVAHGVTSSAAAKRRRARKLLPVSEVEQVFERVVCRSTSTVASLSGVIDRLKQELVDARKELAELRGGIV
jgi:hypothetical protein